MTEESSPTSLVYQYSTMSRLAVVARKLAERLLRLLQEWRVVGSGKLAENCSVSEGRGDSIAVKLRKAANITQTEQSMHSIRREIERRSCDVEE